MNQHGPTPAEAEREVRRHQERLSQATTQGVQGDQDSDPLVGNVGGPQVEAVEHCKRCGQALPKPSEPLATG